MHIPNHFLIKNKKKIYRMYKKEKLNQTRANVTCSWFMFGEDEWILITHTANRLFLILPLGYNKVSN